jgi:hypothetical protein
VFVAGRPWPIEMNFAGFAQVSFRRKSRPDVLIMSITARDPLQKSPLPMNLRCHVAKYWGRTTYIALNRCAEGSMQQPFE